MIGAIVGDVLGSWFETWSTKQKDFPLFQPRARLTDDSVLTAAVARTILDSSRAPTSQEYADQLRSLGQSYPSAGYGGSLREWLMNPQMAAYNSWGNGSAMRVSPVGWAFDTEQEVLEQAERTAMPTHNHPEAIKGAQAVALAVLMARKGASKDEIRTSLTDRFGYDLEQTIEEIRPNYGFEVSCQASVPQAIVAFLGATDFEDALRNAISLGGDADTQACIAGAIAEAHYGEVPAKLLSYVLPRLDDTLLGIVRAFAMRYRDTAAIDAVENEADQRLVADRGVLERAPYRIVISGETWGRIEAYRKRVEANPGVAGQLLVTALGALPVPAPDTEWFLQALLHTKPPQIFAESEVCGDGTDWTLEELSILGDVGIAVPVTVFDDGRHAGPTAHEPPFAGTLLFVPGALLRNGQGETPADWSVVRNGAIDRERYEALYERRLYPLLSYASTVARSSGHRALVTIPGLGCGQFAGPFGGKLGPYLLSALIGILTRHAGDLPGIRAVWFDPYSECQDQRREIGPISLLVRPLRESREGKPQLCPPVRYAAAGDDFSDCELFSMVAWDHVSWPGNDFFCGSRSTDDGVKAAATDSMFAMTGFRGVYDPVHNAYDPPAGVATWGDLVRKNGLQIQIDQNLLVVGTPAKP